MQTERDASACALHDCTCITVRTNGQHGPTVIATHPVCNIQGVTTGVGLQLVKGTVEPILSLFTLVSVSQRRV